MDQDPENQFTDLGDNTALVCVDHQQYQKIVVPQMIDLTYTVQASGDLTANANGWANVDLQVGTSQDLGNGLERVTYRDDVPVSNGPRFMHVKVTK